MNSLEHSGDSSDVGIDLRVREEFSGQVRIQFGLHGRGRIDPKSGVEENVIQQLPGQEREAKQLNQDGLTCSGTYPIHLDVEINNSKCKK